MNLLTSLHDIGTTVRLHSSSEPGMDRPFDPQLRPKEQSPQPSQELNAARLRALERHHTRVAQVSLRQCSTYAANAPVFCALSLSRSRDLEAAPCLWTTISNSKLSPDHLELEKGLWPSAPKSRIFARFFVGLIAFSCCTKVPKFANFHTHARCQIHGKTGMHHTKCL